MGLYIGLSNTETIGMGQANKTVSGGRYFRISMGCFVILGSDHPSFMEAMVKGQRERPNRFTIFIACPTEMVALSMADVYARVTRQPQAVIMHVDVGTQALGCAIYITSIGRVPVFTFADLSPCTLEGDYRGSRGEFIHWLQDVPDQKSIVSQYYRQAERK